MAKQIFKLNSIGRWAYHEGGIVVKAAIGGQSMLMWMKILKVTKTLPGHRSSGFGIVIRCGLFLTIKAK